LLLLRFIVPEFNLLFLALFWELMMPNAHIETLNARHARLDSTLGEESRRPHPDQSRVTMLKREKLKLKEEISRAY